MCEVRIDGEGPGNAEFVHEHEAQAVDGAVVLVAVPAQVVEGFSLFLGGGVMDVGVSM